MARKSKGGNEVEIRLGHTCGPGDGKMATSNGENWDTRNEAEKAVNSEVEASMQIESLQKRVRGR